MSLMTQSLYFTGPRQLAVISEPLPALKPNEVLLEAIVSGISAGTELNVFRGLAPQWRERMDPSTRLFTKEQGSDWKWPARYGYAMVGRISDIGCSVAVRKVGDLVFAYAPPGGHAVVAEDRVVSLGDLEEEETGVFLANLNTAYNGVLDANLPLGADVVVMGLGVIGQIVVRLLKLGGARRIIGVDGIELRRQLARDGGANHLLLPSDKVAETVRELTDGRGADAVIEVSGAAPALNEAIRTTGFNGTVIAMSWYGGTFETLSLAGEFHHNRPRIISSQVGFVNPMLGPLWSIERRSRIAQEYLTLFASDLRRMITRLVPLAEAERAYRLLDQGSLEVMQVLIEYPAEPMTDRRCPIANRRRMTQKRARSRR